MAHEKSDSSSKHTHSCYKSILWEDISA